MTASPSREPAAESEFDLVHALDVLGGARWTIAALTAAGLGVGALYAFLAPPIYQADLMIQTDDGGDSAAKNLLGDAASFFNVNAPASAEAQILSSRLVVTRAVDDLHSYIVAKPKRFPLIGDFVSRLNDGVVQPGLLGIGGYAWGQERANVTRFDVPRRAQGDTFSLTRIDARRYRLSGPDLPDDAIGHIGRAETFATRYGPLSIEVAGFDALPGTRFRLIRNGRADTIDALRTALDVQEKIKQSGVLVATLRGDDPAALGATLNALAQRYVEQNVERRSAEAAHSLAFLRDQLPTVKRQLEEAEQRYATLRSSGHSIDLAEEGKLALQQGADLQTRVLELQQKRDELSRRFLPSHPDMAALDAQLATLRHRQAALDTDLARLPQRQRDEVRAQLDVKVGTDLYTALLNNIQQLELVKAGKTGNVRVVDTAVAPDDPVRPNRPVAIGVGALVGLALGMLIAFARDFLYGGLRSVDEIERHAGLPVLAVVPSAAGQRAMIRAIERQDAGPHLLALAEPYEPAIESLRSLQTALHFSLAQDARPVVLITGPAPGAGKSFVAANFAAVQAADGKRVLLIDGDLRKGRLHQYFGVARDNGFADALAAHAAHDGIVHRGVEPNLDFIATGALPHAPAALLQRASVGALIGQWRAQYDMVVIDAPPVLAAADASWLGKHASAILLVARAGQTKAGELAEAAKRVAGHGGAAPRVVLNGIDARGGRCAYGTKYGGYRYTEYRYANEPEDASARGWRAALRRLTGRAA
ncbi:polysaccharide biosynthesis tyrosine autokinase [Burkholderia sp. AU32262]|uniref:polysaccharide biosynthesis tyrosine autokinase n=1 Tax=Burkholderia sp. AU32262 TaxID=2879630 RepID=UPI001CF4B815|nr:polysaccharide biosynthesis tyrosine autokinase [Burkholderia sp. AU32262]MCA8241810.1 polysaccharide biosynthesis tyrosine autokinase [Burkholderia sp. AU32262]